MAQRTPRPPKASARAPAPSDLEVLHPEREVPLSVGTVTVREYGNVEWLRLLPFAEPLVASIAAMLREQVVPSYEDALSIISRHIDDLLPLVLRAADKDAAWLETLTSGDLENLLMVWWGVNGHFFVLRARNRVMVQYQEQALQERQKPAGARSTPPSSPTDTGPATSATTPNDS